MHAFDCMHASCITGAVSIVYYSNVSFGGETMFANNIAEFGGTAVTCTLWISSDNEQNFPARGYSDRVVLPGL